MVNLARTERLLQWNQHPVSMRLSLITAFPSIRNHILDELLPGFFSIRSMVTVKMQVT
jgi:hypothetical protein